MDKKEFIQNVLKKVAENEIEKENFDGYETFRMYFSFSIKNEPKLITMTTEKVK